VNLSIIIPTYNEAANIGPLVAHLLHNGGNTLAEVIVADGGSTDNTLALATQAGARAVNAPKRGRAAQMNHGAALATGDVLYFVHADARPPANFVGDIAQALDEGYSSGCYRFRFDSDRWLLRLNSYFTRFDSLTVRGGDQTLFVKRSLFEALGGFDEYYVIMEEYDFLRRLWAKNKQTFKLIQKDVLISARKYERNSWLRVQLANLVAMTMFRTGAAPVRIAQTYKKMLNY
jgi:rSAM/selenodomain-associated transferase 2